MGFLKQLGSMKLMSQAKTLAHAYAMTGNMLP
jgi:hypothetical protein